jgi:hypothetical protein
LGFFGVLWNLSFGWETEKFQRGKRERQLEFERNV